MFLLHQSMEFYKRLKAGRALIGWKQDNIAQRSGMSVDAIRAIESQKTSPTAETQRKIISAFEEENVFFTEHGIEQKEQPIRTIYDFVDILKDAKTVLKKGEEIIFHCASEDRSTQETIDHTDALIRRGINLRITLRHGDTNIRLSKGSYRWIDPEYFGNSQVTVIYRDRYIIHIPMQKRFLMIKNQYLADDMRKKFDFAWKNGEVIKND